MADTITFEEEEFEIAYVYDNSQYLHLSNDTRELFIRPYAYGIEITEEGTTTKYPFDNIIGIDGAFEDSKTSIVSNIKGIEPSLTVNEVEATSYAKTVYKDRIALEVTTGTTKFTLVPFVPGTSLTLVDEDGERVLLNYEFFEEYLTSLGHINHETVESFHFLSLDTLVYYNLENPVPSDPLPVTFDYNPRKEFPDLYFTLEGKDYYIELLSTNSGAFRLHEVGTENTKDFFNFDSSYIAEIIGSVQYFHSGKTPLTFKDDFTITHGETTGITYALKSVYNPRYFDYDVHIEFTLNGEERYLLLDPSQTLYEYSADDSDHFIATYIYRYRIPDLVGRYVWDGKYGEESFEFTEDGKFFMDVINETNDGLVNIESEYAIINMPLADGTYQTAISFPYGDMTIYAYKTETTLDVMGISYVHEALAPLIYSRIHASNGYGDIFITKQGRVIFNGEEPYSYSISVSKDDTTGKYTSLSFDINEMVDGFYYNYWYSGDITYNENGEITYSSFKDDGGSYYGITKYDMEEFKTPTEGITLDGYTLKFEEHYLLSGMQDGYHVAIYSGSILVDTIINFDITDYWPNLITDYEALHVNYSTYDFYLYFVNNEMVGAFENSASIPAPPAPPAS